VNTRSPDDFIIEAGPMGAIGEAESLILRVSRNCPWNRCLFCPAYKDRRFSKRTVTDIIKDIDAISRIEELIKKASFEIGISGKVSREVLLHVIRDNPDIFVNRDAIRSLNNVANWLFHGGRRVFLQDANALAMNPGDMVTVLKYLKDSFSTIETITSYARSKTCFRRTSEELGELKNAGLSWCFVGIESGCDEILDYMKKGVKRAEHLEAGRKMVDAGIGIAAFIMPGLAGGNRTKSEHHIKETITLLNDIKPTEVRIRSIAVLEASPLYELYRGGKYEPATEDQMIEEIRLLLEGFDFDCTIETYQMTNVLFNIKGDLNEKRDELISSIERFQSLPPFERSRLRFNKYLHGGYVDFIKRVGRCDESLDSLMGDAGKALEKGSPDAVEKVEQAIFAIKSKAVP
jgi:uncharacterized Fe-S cluster-containing MiaB family protein